MSLYRIHKVIITLVVDEKNGAQLSTHHLADNGWKDSILGLRLAQDTEEVKQEHTSDTYKAGNIVYVEHVFCIKKAWVFGFASQWCFNIPESVPKQVLAVGSHESCAPEPQQPVGYAQS